MDDTSDDAVYQQKIKQAILGKTLDWIDIVYGDARDIENRKTLAVRVKNSVLGAEIEQSSNDRHKSDLSIKTPSLQTEPVVAPAKIL